MCFSKISAWYKKYTYKLFDINFNVVAKIRNLGVIIDNTLTINNTLIL